MFDNLTVSFIVVDEQGTVREFNPAATNTFGYPRDSAVGRPIDSLLSLSEVFACDSSPGSASDTDSHSSDFRVEGEVYCRRIDGSRFKGYLSHGSYDEHGEPLTALIVHTASHSAKSDSRLLEAARKADQASNAKSEFLANMSHEIRTPLNGVMGMLELLMGTTLDTRQESFVKTAYHSATSLVTVIDAILDFSRIESNALEVKPMAFNVREEIEHSTTIAIQGSRGKDIEVSFSLEPDVPSTVKGDVGHLRQVLVNLLSNSVKFTESGRIVVSVSLVARSDSSVQLLFEVEDTGIGIPDDKLSNLFEPFTQGDSSSTREHGGSGLGLTIAKRLIELMNGQIGARSRQGHGTTFWFTLCFESFTEDSSNIIESSNWLPSPQLPPNQDSDDQEPLNDKRVLVVDDVAANRRVCTEMLRKLGVEADVASNGRDALEALSLGSYDLVLMDCQMPVMDGYDATRQIRLLENQQSEGKHLPVIALTAHAMEGDREATVHAGMDDYLTKPLMLSDLESVIGRWLA